MPRILIDLRKERSHLGCLRFYSDDMEMRFQCACLGKADNSHAANIGNPARDSTKIDGDTPTGTFRVLGVRVLGGIYGPNPVVSIEGTSGNALAAKINGRTGLLIHGGALSTAHTLRPTYGCIRVSDSDMAALNAAFHQFGNPTQVIVEEIS